MVSSPVSEADQATRDILDQPLVPEGHVIPRARLVQSHCQNQDLPDFWDFRDAHKSRKSSNPGNPDSDSCRRDGLCASPALRAPALNALYSRNMQWFGSAGSGAGAHLNFRRSGDLVMLANGATGVLDGVRILELARWQAAPRGGLILQDMGAEVLKLEWRKGGGPAELRPVRGRHERPVRRVQPGQEERDPEHAPRQGQGAVSSGC